MLAFRLHGAKDGRLEQIPEPEVRPGTVKIKVEWAGICGSDLKMYSAGPYLPLDTPHPLLGETGPHVFGHEFSGTVTEVGDGVSAISVGDRVAVRPNVWDGTCEFCLSGRPNLCVNKGNIGIEGGGGGFSEFVVVPIEHAHVLPANLSTEVGALVESLSVGWRPVKRSGIHAGQAALVVGGGPIGLAVLLALKAHGVETIFLSEPGKARAELAAKFGATVLDPTKVDIVEEVRKATNGGVHAAFDAAGFDTTTLPIAFESLRDGGTAIVVARFHDPVPIDPKGFLFGEKTITGSISYDDEEFEEVVQAIASGRIAPEDLISSRIPLSDILSRGFEHLLGDGRATEVKILVSPSLAK